MIFGIGTDLIELSRIDAALQRNRKRILQRIGHPAELRQAPARGAPQEVPFWAARFAAKEAFSKAMGTGFGKALSWKDVGVHSERSGRPTLVFATSLQRKIRRLKWRVHVTLSHSASHATATVILERE